MGAAPKHFCSLPILCATAVSASRLKVQKWQVFRGFREFDPDGIPGSGARIHEKR
jgi:hypothetical protein